MNKIKSIFSFVLSCLIFIFYFFFQREQSKRETVEKALEVSKIENSAAKKTLKAIEVKRDVENRNQRDPSDIDKRLLDKGYLRNNP